MPKIAYITKRFHKGSAEVLDLCNQIIESYQAQGYRLTLRQLYYQMIARDLFPESWVDEAYNRKNGLQPSTKNTVKNYKRLGNLISDGRLAGLVDWDAIEDRGRNLIGYSHWADPSEVITAARASFKLDKWENQQYRPEVWVEKEALIGVLEGICRPLDVPCFATKGYNSQSEQWAASRRFEGYQHKGQTPLLIFLSDHDPSGIDMGRDNEERLIETFQVYGLEFERVAMTMEQVRVYNPPPNPAKDTDSRFVAYATLYGDESWELDALDPTTLDDLVTSAILSVRDEDAYNSVLTKEQEHVAILRALEANWQDLSSLIRCNYMNEGTS